ncbi:hypothetical protein [Pseudacidovorax intermedius]|uniref:hypothetical protein n=1 Tax=Pseudacidovorax intermedius TaxID=433924 RepID=UPI0026EA5D88|nr:hypothetical protein [Pseudacidovorax intermedius]
MPDIAAISALLGSVKTATDIARFIRESDLSIERAELKLKVADLVSALADIKIELVDLQEAFAEKEKRIRELEAAFQAKGEMVRRYDAYYHANEEGNPEGVPYCLRCWENDRKQRQLVHDAKEYRIRVCTGCGHRYEGRLAGDIAKKVQGEDGGSQ